MKTYQIKKGKHTSGFNFGITFKRKVHFEAMFDESCIYSIDGIDSYDINKLFGFSTTFSHHNQSARFGWRCIDGVNIEIFAYTYTFGKHHFIDENDRYFLGKVKPNEIFYCGIEDLGDEFLFTFKKSEKERPVTFREKKKKDWLPFQYFLYPYFGGNFAAPHTMDIHIKRV